MAKTAYLVIPKANGMGDQYCCLLSAFECRKKLISLGFDDIRLMWTTISMYFPSHIHPEVIFDTSIYGDDRKFNISTISLWDGEEIDKLKKEYIELPQKQTTMKIYLSEMCDELIDYDAQIHYWNYFKDGIYPIFKNQFFNSLVLDIRENCLDTLNIDRNNIVGINVRLADDFDIQRPYTFFYSGQDHYTEKVEVLEKWIESHSDKRIFISGVSANLQNHLVEKYSHLFAVPPTDHPYSHCTIYNTHDLEQVKRCQRKAAEMTMFAYCKEIFHLHSGGGNYNFLTYGLVHNVHHNNPLTKWDTIMRGF